MKGNTAIKQQRSLEDIASDIRTRMKRTVGDIIAIGNGLHEAKEQLGHSAFGSWCEAQFPDMNRELRSKFMQVAERFGNARISDNLSPSVYQLLASPSVPDEVVSEIIAKADRGERIGVSKVKEAIQRHKTPAKEQATAEAIIARGRAAWEAIRDPLPGKDNVGLIDMKALRQTRTSPGKSSPGAAPFQSTDDFKGSVRYVLWLWSKDPQDTEYPSPQLGLEKAKENLFYKIGTLGIILNVGLESGNFITDFTIKNRYLEHLWLLMLFFVSDKHGSWTDFEDLCLEVFEEHFRTDR